ncbi:MAG: hypothetical protein FJX73_00350 [Armatimonadetes bacterium]|nr:hypothetical protein [Armatimonadota bacterium]
MLFLGLLLVAKPQSPAEAQRIPGYFGAGYVGSETCAGCHQEIYDTFRTTGHPAKLRPAAEARAAGIPKPGYVSWDQIRYVIGGFRWKARYVDQEGYIITGSPDGKISGRNQFNLETQAWANYNAGQKMRYDCGECHTTGYSPVGNQHRKPGFVGTWALDGIQCEACHGRGQVHAKAPSKANIQTDRSAALCGTCHRRGTDMGVIPAAGGFVEHREQYQEFLASPHKALSCVTCHDPHRRAREVKAKGTCEACHTAAAAAFRGSRHQRAALTCTGCHMPNTGRNAVVRSKYEADDPSHLFKINLDPAARMFTDDGRFVRAGSNTLEFACLRCHADRTQAWAAGVARGIHRLGK